MAYATVDDVKALAPQLRIGPNTVPTDHQVEQFITDIEAEVESACVNLGYVVPITGTRALAIMKTIVATGTLSRVLHARAYAIGRPNDQGADTAEAIFRRYLRTLADPRDRTMELNDAPRTDVAIDKTAAGKVAGMGSVGTGDADFDWQEPTVTRDQVF